MSEITQNSYDETDLNQKVVFQKGRDVCDYELNEAQDNLRVLQYRIAQILGGDGVATGIRVTSPGVANQVQVGAGTFNAAGYRGSVSNTLITGLTTPASGSRTDIVYARFRELTVDDPRPLTELGVLSQRKVLSVTFGVAQGGPLPTSTGFPWEGGDYYMGLASIARTAGQPTILSSDITQTFTLLPHASLSQMAVYLDGYVNRLRAGAAGTVESPVADMTLDTALATSYSASHSFIFRYGKSHATENIHSVARNSKVTFGAPTGTKNPLVIRDSVLVTDIPFSDDSSGSEQAAGRGLYDGLGQPVTTGYTSRSILRVLNGRASATIGNGTSTFGDFNGATALVNVIAAAISNYATSLHLFVKQGTYVIPSTLTATGLDLVIEGADQSECVFQNTHASQTSIVTTSRLQIKRITFTRTLTATKAITAGNLFLEDVTVTGMSVNMTGGTGARTWDRVSLSGAGILVDLGGEDTKGSLLIRDSRLVSSATGLPLIYSVVAAGPIAEVTLERCFCIVGIGVDSGVESGLVDIQSSFTQTTSGARSLLKFRFLGCTFEGNGVPSCFQVGVRVLPYMEFAGCMFTHTGRTLAATHLPVFHPRAVNLLIRDCYFDLQGVCSSFGGGVAGGALDFLALETLTVRNLSVNKTYAGMFDDIVVSTAGLSVIYMIAGQHVDVDGISVRILGTTFISSTLPRQVVYVESDSGNLTRTAILRNVRHETYTGETNSAICSQAYIRVAGTFGKAIIENCDLQFGDASRMPVGTNAILLGAPIGDDIVSTSNVEVRNCYVAEVYGNGVADYSTGYGCVTIRGCYIYHAGTSASGTRPINVLGGGTNTCEVLDNRIVSSPGIGIFVLCTYAVIRGNYIQDCALTLGDLVYVRLDIGFRSASCYENQCVNTLVLGVPAMIAASATDISNTQKYRGFDTIENVHGSAVDTFDVRANGKAMRFNNALLRAY